MWTLGRFLLLFIGDEVPVENKYWENLLMLLMIMDILFAPTFRRDDCGYLESLINDHYVNFRLLYPHLLITPKMHYLIHTPCLMLE